MTKEGVSGPFPLHSDATSLPEWMPVAVETASIFVVLLAFWSWRKDRLRLQQIGALMLAGWGAETVAMMWYDYYAYAPTWTLWLGHVPLAVVGVWPVVILTSYQVIRATVARESTPIKVALLTGLLVIFDAAFIEPVAVRMGLWAWQDGTYFGVPALGYIGWGFLGFSAAFIFEEPRFNRWLGFNEQRGLSSSWLLAPPVMIFLCHLFLAPCVFSSIKASLTIPVSTEIYSYLTLALGILLGALGFRLGHKCPFRFRDFWLLIAGSIVFFTSIYVFWLEPFVWSLATWPLLFWGLGLVPYKKAT